MKRIALISDTHNYLDTKMFKYFDSCDEIWHAGDIGTIAITDELQKIKPVRAVYGNIDGADVRIVWPQDQRFVCEGVDVLITHIGGYPGRYDFRIRDIIITNTPQLFICGHSHILKVIPDKKFNLLHINPGAAGIHGFHKLKTMVRFSLHNGKITDLEAIELGLRTEV